VASGARELERYAIAAKSGRVGRTAKQSAADRPKTRSL
jgi:hypothetical protein